MGSCFSARLLSVVMHERRGNHGQDGAQFGKRENPDSWGSLGFCFPGSRCQVPWTLPFLEQMMLAVIV